MAAAAQTPESQALDTTTYEDLATAELIEQARGRHAYQDRLVQDYSALVRTRIDAGFGRSRFARIPPILAHETAARVVWSLPNDLKIDVLGERSVTIFKGTTVDAGFDRPWFIPRSLADSIRLVGDDLPTTAALHPLADGAEDRYHYAIADSVTMVLPGRTVHAIAVRVEPKQMAPSLVAGDIWLDAATAEVVRFMFVFVGDLLWGTPDEETADDSASARNDNKWANRILKLEADLEYALFESRYWMPHRQLLQLTVEVPWFLNLALPVRFLTTFDEYEVNVATLPAFEAPPPVQDVVIRDDGDTVEVRQSEFRCPAGVDECDKEETGYYRMGASEQGGRWEVHYPPADSLHDYDWPDDLSLNLTKEDEDRIKETLGVLGGIQARLPGDWVGRRRMGVALETFSDVYRFNRVQGSSIGLGYEFRPDIPFTRIIAQARYGFSDKRPTGSLTWRRDAPAGRLDVSAYRAVHEVEPWTSGLGFGNSINGIFAGHDDADYLLALGGGISFASYAAGLWRDVVVGLFFERQRSMAALARSGVNDALGGTGLFQANAPILEGDFVRATFSRNSRVGRADFRQGVEALVGVDSLVTVGRVWASAEIPFFLFRRSGDFTARVGYAVGDVVPQMLFRAGGSPTVRGYTYGVRVGRGLWSAQLDYELRESGLIRPVLFADIGNVFDAPDGVTVPSEPLLALGAGVSFLGGLIRFNLAKGINPGEDVRFDLLFGTIR